MKRPRRERKGNENSHNSSKVKNSPGKARATCKLDVQVAQIYMAGDL